MSRLGRPQPDAGSSSARDVRAVIAIVIFSLLTLGALGFLWAYFAEYGACLNPDNEVVCTDSRMMLARLQVGASMAAVAAVWATDVVVFGRRLRARDTGAWTVPAVGSALMMVVVAAVLAVPTVGPS